MGEETITVGEVSRGDDAGTGVELPIVDLLTGRGFITGKSGSGKSNSASVVAEKLLDRGYSLLAVDIDGEYYGLKEEYEILHVGGDEECDLQVNEEHAGKIAELALEQNVPIILDISSFLDESEARDLLTEVTKHLFAKEKKLKQPFMMLVEEVHEFIPEGGGMDECGRMLIKVGKRGRKHGLGIVGISQRPADVKKDFITQCDWLCWHRLTWNNDTKVVGRILGTEYADHIEEMDDGECFLMTDWAENIRVVQFERKRTFDAGATPGLDDFERPELKSVSGDLVEELQEITETQQQRENRIEELQRELKQKDERISDLERQLSEAQDLKQMADRFSRAMMEQVTGRPLSAAPGRQSELEEVARKPVRRDPELEAELDAVRSGEREPESGQVPDASNGWEGSDSDGAESHTRTVSSDEIGGEPATEDDSDREVDTPERAKPEADPVDDAEGPANFGDAFDGIDSVGAEDPTDDTEPTVAEVAKGEPRSPTAAATEKASDPLVDRLRDEIYSLDDIAVEMLRHYRDYGPTTPQEAHAAAGGSGDRTESYAVNRALRQRGLVAHVGRGKHDYALPSLVAEESVDPFEPNERLPDDERDELVRAIEAAFVESIEPQTGDATAAADGGEIESDRTDGVTA
ncbi:MAG: helicase HerA domain-containing protein, partial [Natronomonas sp.]